MKTDFDTYLKAMNIIPFGAEQRAAYALLLADSPSYRAWRAQREHEARQAALEPVRRAIAAADLLLDFNPAEGARQ